ncbi:PucR family transcriptional regulator [Streptomyces cyaneochromogenes]|uniref:PucR family transcriptional regulator n=1 Tax=Streptomyces cyaneochromogenes TaxID=2496836 RepID=A0A3S9LZ89_9ACTN|nr:helix-turn-helix domain-containing protein [Streptomyces cyaneochromogenes]AZQ32261.1 PucR family transcriptional regulator [Streptomyces cyaneochromogenes]
MGSLFAELARQAAANARREVETYLREIPEFRSWEINPRTRIETMEYSVWLRRRTIELSPDNSELTDDDLGYIAAIGEVRADAGMSSESRQQVLHLHTTLMLRDIQEAAESLRGRRVEELMQVMTWFAPQGDRGIAAYRQGFVTVLHRRLPYVEQVALLARSLLSGDPMAADLAAALDLQLPEFCAVTVIRVPDRPPGDHDLNPEIETLVKAHRVPAVWYPQSGTRGGELIAVVPCADEAIRLPTAPDAVEDLVGDFTEALGRPCAAGTATAPLDDLPAALERARRISRSAPLGKPSRRARPYTMADVFVELAVADVPFIDAWLHTVAQSLEPGPDLVSTLDAYYRHDMNRGAAAASLNVHPRTLDYRLRRVAELTGIEPGSVHGIRTLSAVVSRRLSGAWA